MPIPNTVNLENLLIGLFNYIGIIAFAFSGAFKAYEKNLDLLGGIVLGSSVALAGGIIRDVLVGTFPPVNITYLPYPATAVIASLVAYLFYPCISRYQDALMYADAVGLGTFAALGANVAVEHHLNVLGVMLLAAVTAAGGGVVRDVLANEVPVIFRQDIYATLAALGGLLYLAFNSLLGSEAAILATAITIITIRFIVIMRGLNRAYLSIRLTHGIRNKVSSESNVNPHSR